MLSIPVQMLIAFVLLPVLDAPWLWFQSTNAREMFAAIQCGRTGDMRLWAAAVVYVALAYLLTQQTSMLGAALSGSAVYAVYDFTNLALLQRYTLSFAIQDTLWGGVLFGIAWWLLDTIKKQF